MTSKVIWFDTETTGLDPKVHTVVQLAGHIEIDYEIVESFNFFCNPGDHPISPEALEITKKTEEQLRAYPPPTKARKEFVSIMSKYVNKFDKFDKFLVGGFNARFDLDFIQEWLKEGGEQYFFSFVSPTTIDPMHLSAILQYLGAEDYSMLQRRNLQTLCKHHGIALDENAHDAFFDIEATRLLARKQLDILEKL